MDSNAAVFFLNQLREARAIALRDAEDFQEILFVLERLGLFEMKGNGDGSLYKYRGYIKKIADSSPLSSAIPQQHIAWHSSFEELYDTVKEARNDAMHQGIFARHLTNHAVQVALILEDALMNLLSRASEFMVRNPICASLWQPVSFVRQQMLANSFSYLPVLLNLEGEEVWHLISDYHIAKYLRSASSNGQRKSRLAETVEKAISSKLLETEKATCIQTDTEIEAVVQHFDGQPLLVLDKHSHLVGILTSYDLL